MTSSRNLSSHLPWLTSGSSLPTLFVAASLFVLPSNRLQAADEVRGGPGVAQQAVDQSRVEELRARQQKLDADNKAIDAGMKEARDKANTAMDAATREMATGVAAGTAQIGAAAAGLGQPAAQGQVQQGQASALAGVAALVAQRDDLSRALANQLASTGDKLAQKQDEMARESELKSKRAQRDQLDQKILEQLATIRRSSQSEAQTAQERMKSLQVQMEAEVKKKQQQAEQAKDRGGLGTAGTIFGGPLVGTAIGREIAGQADNVQRAKSAEAIAVKTEIGILAAQHDEKTRAISQLNAEAQKAKGSKASELKAEMAALVAQRNKLNESIGAQTAELRKVKDAEREAAERQLKQINSMQEALKREAAEREAASKKGKAADRAEAQSQMQQLKGLQDALNGSASAQKKALSQIAAEQSEIAKREALQKKVAEGLRANPGKLDALIIPKDSGKTQRGGQGGVGSYAGLTAGALAGQKGGEKDAADTAVAKALKQIQDKATEKSVGDKGKAASQIGNIQNQQNLGKAAAETLRGQVQGREAATAAAAKGAGAKPEGDAEKKTGLRVDQENKRLAKPESASDKKSGSRIDQMDKAITESKRLTKPESGQDKKTGSNAANAAIKQMQEAQREAERKKSGSKLDEAVKSQQSKQLEQNRATSGAKAADQVKRMEEATKQRMDQFRAKEQAISSRCPNPPCNVMQQRAPSASAMDRLGGGPSPTLAGTKAAVGVKANSKANSSQNNALQMIRLQETISKKQQAIQTIQNMQQKQSETSGAIIRNVR